MCFTLKAQAQSMFNKTYYYPSADSASRTESYSAVIELHNQNILCGGISWNAFNGNTKLLIERLNSEGVSLDRKIYGDSGDYFNANRMKYLRDSTIGFSLVKSSYLNDSVITYFFMLNENGDTLWTKKYDNWAVKNVCRDFVPTQDGGLILIGWTSTGSSSYSQMFCTKTDSAGSIEWSKQYGDTVGYLVGTGIVQLQDGGYFVTSWVSEGPTNTYIRNGRLMRLDALGNELWERDYGSTGLFDYFEQIGQVNSNEFVMMGTRCMGPGFNQNADGWYMMVDSMGNVNIDKHFGSETLEEIYNFRRSGNNFFASGSKQFGTSGRNRGYLQLISDNLDSIWSKTYYYDTTGSFYDNYFWNMDLCQDGGVVMCGQAIPGITGTQDAWLVKTDANGCIDTACSLLAEVPQLVSSSTENVFLYPNPTTSFSALKISGDFLNEECLVTVIDINGRIKYSTTFLPNRTENTFPLRSVEPGIYFVKVHSEQFDSSVKWVVL
jgi:hypothetical protein